MRMRRKVALAATEIAIAVGLSAVVVILAIGLFTNGLNGVIDSANGVFNMFKDNTQKTSYTAYKRDYTQSQIDVQVTGAQGLEMLRRRANNLALELIENNFSNTNKRGNDIAYLSKAIEIISGEPHICAYMKTDSNKHCDDFSAYAYKTQISSSLIINKVNGGSITLPLIDAVAKALDVNVPKDSYGASALTTPEQYSAILALTQALSDYIDKSVSLMSITDAATADNSGQIPAADLAELLKPLSNSIKENRNTCKCSFSDTPNWLQPESKCGKHVSLFRLRKGSKSKMFINGDEYNKFNQLISNMNTAEDVKAQLTPDSELVNIVKQDNRNDPKSCKVLLDIVDVLNTKGLNIAPFECVPNTSD